MATCSNCSSELTVGGLFKDSNKLLEPAKIDRINLAYETNFTELCEKCGSEKLQLSAAKILGRIDPLRVRLEQLTSEFPIFTVDVLPPVARYVLKGLVTSNVTVGTGVVSEASQVVTDVLGSTTADTGMAHKHNVGERSALSLIVSKAVSLGANAIIGIDIDYGATRLNAATVNIQGTAIKIENLSEVVETNFSIQEIEELTDEIRNLESYISVELHRPI
ncbi:MAG: hypothetical protein RL392_885 [Pseudomonadota bacterium]|jgi:uncharacterized protein YbjQ (UPF0145 family)